MRSRVFSRTSLIIDEISRVTGVQKSRSENVPDLGSYWEPKVDAKVSVAIDQHRSCN